MKVKQKLQMKIVGKSHVVEINGYGFQYKIQADYMKLLQQEKR